MKKVKKLMALVIALAMVLGMMGMTVLADEESGGTPKPQAEPGEFTGGDFSQDAETVINATGLKEGDSVKVYQLVKWDNATSDWALNGACGVTLAELVNGITEAEATTIATTVADTQSITTLTANADGKVSYDCSNNPGLFYLKAIPGTNNKDTAYNPAFVSADYYAGGNTVSFSDTIGSSAVIKSSTITFDKDVVGNDKMTDVAVGDVIPYVITTQIPSYGTSYKNLVFTVSDTLSAGLEMVKEGDPAALVEPEVTVDGTKITDKTNVYELTQTASGFTVSFLNAYLAGLDGASPVVSITYSAKVTTEALNNVTYMDNKAKLTFTNAPGTTANKEDITRHYTFSIDANIQGGTHGNERSRELIKVKVNDKNEVVTAFTSWVEGKEWTSYSALEGAKFQLVGNNGKTYTAESDGDGYISFYGLDEGTYTLTETEAPNGYIRDTKDHIVVIEASYQTDTDILTGYTITVDGQNNGTASPYSITNIDPTNHTVETTIGNGFTFPFVNTPGAELPSTGGIGTTIFYVVGAILVIGAGVVLVTKRRMNQ